MTQMLDLGARQSLRRHLAVGLSVVAFFFVGIGGWAATTELSGAVIAPGLLVVESNVKKVQHPSGGVVGELHVREGDKVKAGDVLVRLDETVTRANLSILVNSLDELAARQARLQAERDGAEALVMPADLTARRSDPQVATIVAGELKVFDLRRKARAGQEAQLKERLAQLRQEIEGLTGQAAAKSREIELIGRELDGVRELWRKNLVSIQRVNALERDATRLEGERGHLTAAAAQAKGRVSEVELQIIQIEQDLRSEVARELREVQGRIAELVERKAAAEDQLKRTEIRAPQNGAVHQLNIHTIGGVIGPGDTLMLIVPDADTLTVEAKIAPQDIDQVSLGQRAILRLSAFNQGTTPELTGEIGFVSADLTTDQRTGASYYTVRIGLPGTETARLGALKLLPGMPVEAFVQTGERTALSYLTKPLRDQMARAFKSD